MLLKKTFGDYTWQNKVRFVVLPKAFIPYHAKLNSEYRISKKSRNPAILQHVY